MARGMKPLQTFQGVKLTAPGRARLDSQTRQINARPVLARKMPQVRTAFQGTVRAPARLNYRAGRGSTGTGTGTGQINGWRGL